MLGLQPFDAWSERDALLHLVIGDASGSPRLVARIAELRAEILRRCHELMTARAEELATLISLENGKALPDARGEVEYGASFVRWFAEGRITVDGGKVSVKGVAPGATLLFSAEP